MPNIMLDQAKKTKTGFPIVIITIFDGEIETVYHPNHTSTITRYHQNEAALSAYLSTLDQVRIEYDLNQTSV